jgi:hypothetical protein
LRILTANTAITLGAVGDDSRIHAELRKLRLHNHPGPLVSKRGLAVLGEGCRGVLAPKGSGALLFCGCVPRRQSLTCERGALFCTDFQAFTAGGREPG